MPATAASSCDARGPGEYAPGAEDRQTAPCCSGRADAPDDLPKPVLESQTDATGAASLEVLGCESLGCEVAAAMFASRRERASASLRSVLLLSGLAMRGLGTRGVEGSVAGRTAGGGTGEYADDPAEVGTCSSAEQPRSSCCGFDMQPGCATQSSADTDSRAIVLGSDRMEDAGVVTGPWSRCVGAGRERLTENESVTDFAPAPVTRSSDNSISLSSS